MANQQRARCLGSQSRRRAAAGAAAGVAPDRDLASVHNGRPTQIQAQNSHQAVGLRPAAGRARDIRREARPEKPHAIRAWPLAVMAVPAAVAVWSGWVGIGQMTGFGLVHPLPGLWDALRVNTAITMPIGVEAYGAYALKAWLAASVVVSPRTRKFARNSAVGSLLLGMAGQVAYHLLAQRKIAEAPWEITTAVSCLPVIVLGMAAALTHMIRAGAGPGRNQRASVEPNPDSCRNTRSEYGTAQANSRAPSSAAAKSQQGAERRAFNGDASSDELPSPPVADDALDSVIGARRLAAVQDAAAYLASAGITVSRRTLRAAGVRGPNSELGTLAKALRSTDTGSEAETCRPKSCNR